MGVVLHCSFLAKPVGLYLAVLEHFLKNVEIGEILMLCYKSHTRRYFPVIAKLKTSPFPRFPKPYLLSLPLRYVVGNSIYLRECDKKELQKGMS